MEKMIPHTHVSDGYREIPVFVSHESDEPMDGETTNGESLHSCYCVDFQRLLPAEYSNDVLPGVHLAGTDFLIISVHSNSFYPSNQVVKPPDILIGYHSSKSPPFAVVRS